MNRTPRPLTIDPAAPRRAARDRVAVRWFARPAAGTRPTLVARWGTDTDVTAVPARRYPTAA